MICKFKFDYEKSINDWLAELTVSFNNLFTPMSLFQIETYVSSEVNEEAIKVSKLHHPEVVQIGDIASLTPQKVSTALNYL